VNRLDLISRPRADQGSRHRRPAILASLLVHGCALGAIVTLAFFYRAYLPLPSSGSAAGSTSICLEKITVASPPVEPPPAPIPMPRITPPTPGVTVPQADPGVSPAHPEIGVPVLSAQPTQSTKPTEAMQAQERRATHPAGAQAVQATAQEQARPAGAAAVSSYAPGESVLPHPPYPEEARDCGQTGTVVMNVIFDARGAVARAEVAQSSGIAVLDAKTRSFIRANWHSAVYAGQVVSVPVEYTLQKM